MNRWLDIDEYPFSSHYLDVPAGRMHYVDEGDGDPIVMIHGNPTWSFVYRHLLKGLAQDYRCIAPDLIGFGLSDKPRDWSYLPEEHARNIHLLIEKLDLHNITLVVQDWGGPIGMSYAVQLPENVRSIILMNSWMWPVNGDPHYERFSGFMGGGVGRFLIKHFNFFVGVVMRQAMGDKKNLSKAIHQHYFQALKEPDDRKGCWTFPKHIIASGRWLETLWSQRDRLKTIPTLILWGIKDIAFREKELATWMNVFADPTVVRFNDVGHYVQEEKGSELCPIIRDFLADLKR